MQKYEMLQELLKVCVYESSTGRLIKTTTGKYGDTTINNWGYREIKLDKGNLGKIKQFAHRVVWMLHNGDIPLDKMVDHINLDKTDNRIENLRLVDKSGNAQNSIWKGYCFDKRSGKYKAEIKLHGRRTWLGLHDTEEQARAAYLEAKAKLHPFASADVLK